MIGMQEMLLQCVDDKLYILPAWPKDWDVVFKLHASNQTTAEVTYRSGKVEKMEITPAARAKDVVLPAGP